MKLTNEILSRTFGVTDDTFNGIAWKINEHLSLIDNKLFFDTKMFCGHVETVQDLQDVFDTWKINKKVVV